MIPRRIVCIGASTIYGSSDDELGGFVTRLRFWSESLHPRNRVYNLGIWGEQTASLLERLPQEVTPRRPQLIIVYPGFNDCRRVGAYEADNVVPLDQYRVMMDELVSSAQSHADTLMLSGYPFDEARTCPIAGTTAYYRSDDAKRYMAQLVQSAVAHKADVIDFFSMLNAEQMQKFLAEDGLHGNAHCHQYLFESIRDAIVAKYGLE